MGGERYEGSSGWTDPHGLQRQLVGHQNGWVTDEMEFQRQKRNSCLHCTELSCPRVQGSSNSHWAGSQQDKPAEDYWTPIKQMARNVLNCELLGLGWDS